MFSAPDALARIENESRDRTKIDLITVFSSFLWKCSGAFTHYITRISDYVNEKIY